MSFMDIDSNNHQRRRKHYIFDNHVQRQNLVVDRSHWQQENNDHRNRRDEREETSMLRKPIAKSSKSSRRREREQKRARQSEEEGTNPSEYSTPIRNETVQARNHRTTTQGKERRQERNSRSISCPHPPRKENTTSPLPYVKPTRAGRGVHPRLSTRCPVTSRKLMDDPSVTSASMFTNKSPEPPSEDDDDDDTFHIPVTPASTSKSQTVYAQLNSEIANFQKIIAELESLFDKSAESPEVQWRSRILLRSAHDTAAELQHKVDRFDRSYRGTDHRTRMALRKLQRDLRRVHHHYQTVTAAYNQRQTVDVAFLTAKVAGNGEEDFFDRAMREREAELSNIHSSMKQVNEIYSDLAAIVDGQQEQLDRIGEGIEEAHANTKSGLKHVQRTVQSGLCGAADTGKEKSRAVEWSFAIEDMISAGDNMLKQGQKLLNEIVERGCAVSDLQEVSDDDLTEVDTHDPYSFGTYSQ